MNNELIEKLKGVGFKYIISTITLRKDIGKDFECNFNSTDSAFWVYYKVFGESRLFPLIENPTFEQILTEIKKRTGVDLTKKTKREEIEQLKTKVASLEDAIKSQNDVIEANKKDAHRANDRLTMVLRRLKVLGVWKDEEPNKQASEMQTAEAKGFKVDDRVVLIKNPQFSWSDRLRALAEKEVVLKITSLDDKIAILSNSVGAVYLDSFLLSDLEHAPKESPKEKALEWGDFKMFNGKKVLVAHKLISTAVIVFRDGSWNEANLSDLKPL